MYRVSAALALLLAPLPAAAEDWFRLKPISDTGYNFVDLDSIHVQGKLVVAHSLSVHLPTIPDTRFRWMWIEAEYDCAENAARFLSIRGYDTDREMIADIDRPLGDQFLPAQPGSDGNAITAFICNTSREGAVRVSDPWAVLPPAEDQ
ncbi:MAG: surface-adhesin E family protein [Sphingomonas sp.]